MKAEELVAALEAYWEENVAAQGEQTKLINRLKALVTHSGVDPATLACSEQQLQRLVAARHMGVHLGRGTPDERRVLDDAMIDNARRAALLFQACLLRDLDVAPQTVTGWIQRHLKSWPIA